MRRRFSFGVPIVAFFLGTCFISRTQFFAKDACDRVERFLNQEVLGQALATTQLIDAVCDHLGQKEPIKPLILSVHGPPGVGKTHSHRSLALALFGLDEGKASAGKILKRILHSILGGLAGISQFTDSLLQFLRKDTSAECPGEGCRGYKILYGIDYASARGPAQQQALVDLLLTHIKKFRESLIVVEEYDKLDCEMRGFLRRVFEHPFTANVSMANSIIMLESNLGMLELEALFEQRGKTGVTPEDAHRRLKDVVFEHWLTSDCETRVDTLRMVNLVDYFLPYFSLRRDELRAMFRKALDKRLLAVPDVDLTFGDEVVEFLIDKVEFENEHSLEGGRTVDTVISRYLGRVLREQKQGGAFSWGDFIRKTQRAVVLSVDDEGAKIVASPQRVTNWTGRIAEL